MLDCHETPSFQLCSILSACYELSPPNSVSLPPPRGKKGAPFWQPDQNTALSEHYSKPAWPRQAGRQTDGLRICCSDQTSIKAGKKRPDQEYEEKKEEEEAAKGKVNVDLKAGAEV